MADRRPRNSDVVRRWVDANEDWLDRLAYGAVEFVFTGHQPPRVNRRDSEQVDVEDPDLGHRLTA